MKYICVYIKCERAGYKYKNSITCFCLTDDPVGRTETDRLREEANMPLDELLAKYGIKDEAGEGGSEEGPSGSGASGKKGQFISPALRSKGHSRTSSSSSQDNDVDAAGDSKPGGSASSSSSPVSRGKKSKVSANGDHSNGLSNGLDGDDSRKKQNNNDSENKEGGSGSSSSVSLSVNFSYFEFVSNHCL